MRLLILVSSVSAADPSPCWPGFWRSAAFGGGLVPNSWILSLPLISFHDTGCYSASNPPPPSPNVHPDAVASPRCPYEHSLITAQPFGQRMANAPSATCSQQSGRQKRPSCQRPAHHDTPVRNSCVGILLNSTRSMPQLNGRHAEGAHAFP